MCIKGENFLRDANCISVGEEATVATTAVVVRGNGATYLTKMQF